MKKIFLAVLLSIFLATSAFAGQLLPYPKFKATDGVGVPYAGGLLYTYAQGTSTAKAAYTDVNLTTSATNPIVLDSNGEAAVYLKGKYKLILKTSAGVTVWTLDNVQGMGDWEEGKYYVDAAETDQGVVGSGNSIAAHLATIGSENAILKFANTSGTTTTSYTISTAIIIPANVRLEIEPGALLAKGTGSPTLTINGTVDEDIRQIFSGWAVGNVTFGKAQKVYPEWWGALGDGSTDDSTAINSAIAAMTNGGVVSFGPLTYMGNVVLYSNITLQGSGIYKTVLKAPASSGADVIKGKDFATLTGTAKATPETRGANFTSIRDMTVDGNKANNAAGFGIRIWGRNMNWQNVYVMNCSEDGIWTEFTTHDSPTGADDEDPRAYDVNSLFLNIRSSGNGGNGWTYEGPHDGAIIRYQSFANAGWALYQDGTYSNLHSGAYWDSWLNTTGSYYIGSGGKLSQITASGAYIGTGIELKAGIGSVQITDSIVSGHLMGIIARGDSNYIQAQVANCRDNATEGSATAGDGIHIDGLTNSTIDVYGSSNYNAIKFTSETGPNKIHGRFSVPAGFTLYTGTPGARDNLDLIDYVSYTGLKRAYGITNEARAEIWDSAAPVAGTWARGDICWNNTPSSGGPPGWVCTTAGTPGTWKAMANLE